MWFPILKKKRKNNTNIIYRHECEPVSPALITVSRDAIQGPNTNNECTPVPNSPYLFKFELLDLQFKSMNKKGVCLTDTLST